MKFTKIDSFDDMVEANLSFLQTPRTGVFDIDAKISTPIHWGPPRRESDFIIKGLQNLCSQHRVMTMGSQPAYTRKGFRRQRGYIDGVISLPEVSLNSLAMALEKVGGLEYCLYRRIVDLEIDRDRLRLEKVMRVNVLGHPFASQWWRNGSWSSEGATFACCGEQDYWAQSMFSTLTLYERCNKYGNYLVTEDVSIIVFEVADDAFDLGVSRCCDKLQEALGLINN